MRWSSIDSFCIYMYMVVLFHQCTSSLQFELFSRVTLSRDVDLALCIAASALVE